MTHEKPVQEIVDFIRSEARAGRLYAHPAGMEITGDTTIGELCLDSLATVQLMAAVEEVVDEEVPDHLLHPETTIAQLAGLALSDIQPATAGATV